MRNGQVLMRSSLGCVKGIRCSCEVACVYGSKHFDIHLIKFNKFINLPVSLLLPQVTFSHCLIETRSRPRTYRRPLYLGQSLLVVDRGYLFLFLQCRFC
jgi:hypothetical protein